MQACAELAVPQSVAEQMLCRLKKSSMFVIRRGDPNFGHLNRVRSQFRSIQFNLDEARAFHDV